MTPLLRRFREQGHAMLRRAREVATTTGVPNKSFQVRRAMREARYAFTCAARLIHVHKAKGAM